MKRLLLNEREFLKKKEIKFGHVYIFKDGRLGLYLGTSLDNQFVFYILAKAHLVQTDDYGILTFAHYENQVKFLIELSDELLQSKCDKNVLYDLLVYQICIVILIIFLMTRETNCSYGMKETKTNQKHCNALLNLRKTRNQ